MKFKNIFLLITFRNPFNIILLESFLLELCTMFLFEITRLSI